MRGDAGSHAKNTVVMSNGELVWGRPSTYGGMLDRSPCGTGNDDKIKLPRSSVVMRTGIVLCAKARRQ